MTAVCDCRQPFEFLLLKVMPKSNTGERDAEWKFSIEIMHDSTARKENFSRAKYNMTIKNNEAVKLYQKKEYV